MKIEYINESLTAIYSADGHEDYAEFAFLKIQKDIESLINESILDAFDYQWDIDHFRTVQDFPYFKLGLLYGVQVVLSQISEKLYLYYSKAAYASKKNPRCFKTYDAKSVQVQFTDIDLDYMGYDEAVEYTRNMFLDLIPKKLLFELVKEVIFCTEFNSLSQKFVWCEENDLVEKYNGRFSSIAYIYFMQIDLLNLTYKDLLDSNKVYFDLDPGIDIFRDSKAESTKKVRDILDQYSFLKINTTKNNSKLDRLKRIFDMYLIEDYPSVMIEGYVGKPGLNIESNVVFRELRRRYHAFSEKDSPLDVEDYKVAASENNGILTIDREKIKRIKGLRLEKKL